MLYMPPYSSTIYDENRDIEGYKVIDTFPRICFISIISLISIDNRDIQRSTLLVAYDTQPPQLKTNLCILTLSQAPPTCVLFYFAILHSRNK